MPDVPGWCPFAQQHSTPKFWPGNQGRKAVVLHIAQGGFSGSLEWLRNENTNPNSSAHFIVSKDGLIAQLVSVHNSAWGNGLCWKNNLWHIPSCTRRVNPGWAGIVPGVNPNWYTISIEHEGRSGDPMTPAMEASTVRLLQWIADVFDLNYVPKRTLIGHSDINSADKSFCPGPAFDLARIAQTANQATSSITEDSALLSLPRARAIQARAYIVGRGSVYDPHDIGVIVDHYWRYALTAGIDPLLAVAQCAHETSEKDPATGKWRPISSWWARRPRRNPAGIGVTGATRATTPPDQHNWVRDTDAQPPVWRAGLVFASWDESARAHLGRLLAYAIPAGQGTEVQKSLIAYALDMRQLDPSLRGTAPTLKRLGAKHNPTGNGWADPGDKYGAKIAEVARAIRDTPV